MIHFLIGELRRVLSRRFEKSVVISALQHGAEKVGVQRTGRSLRSFHVLWRVDRRKRVGHVLGRPDLRARTSHGADGLHGQTVAEDRVVPHLIERPAHRV